MNNIDRFLMAAAAAVFASAASASTITVAPSGGDYADIASAVAAAKTAIAGGEASVTINVAAGEYALTAQIELDGPITLSGAGVGQTILKRDTSVKSMRIAYLNNADAVIEKATLRDGKNTSTGAAGGVLIDAGTLQDCEVVNCALAHWGSGWNGGSCVRLNSANARILRCSLHDNSTASSLWGTGLALFIDGNGVADSCLIYGNGNDDGSSSYIVYVNNGTLRNCTVTDNYCAKKTAVYVVNNTNAKVIDCVVCDNYGTVPTTGQVLGNGFDFLADNATALARCVNTVVENPGFMNEDVRDYRLNAASPYVDTGADGTASVSAYDLSGTTPRLCDAAVDPGCYEANRGTTPVCLFTCANRVGLTDEDITLNLFSTNVVDDPEYTVNWGDGTVETVQGATAAHAYANSGIYSVSLSVSGAQTYARSDYLTVKPKNVYVSATGSATAPYDTPAKATSAIEDAVAAAANGSTVWVAPSATPYKFSKAERLCIRDGIKIVGQGDAPTDVVFAPYQASKHRMFLLGHEGAGLYNITVQGGYGESQISALPGSGACVFIEPTGGTVSNCVIRNANDSQWGNIAAGVAMQGGLVTHCVLSNLTASCAAGGNRSGMVAHLAGGSMENCLITQNSGTGKAEASSGGVVALSGSGRLVNCTIAGNQMSGASGVYVQSTTAKVINCLIGDNRSTAITGDTVTTYVGYSGGKAIDVTDCFVNCAAEIKINDTCQTGNLGFASASTHDYSIILGSCAQDNGTIPTGYVPPAKDLAGADRVDDGGIDIGCYELHVSGVVSTFTVSAAKGAAPVEVTFEATVGGADPTECTYEWDVFGDGSEIVTTDVPRLVYIYEAYGNFAAKLVVKKDGESYPSVNTQPFRSYPKDLYVNAAGEAPEAPYDTPAKAAATIADAFAVASDGSTVHVMPGTYTVSQQILIDESVTIAGSTGNPEDVIVKKGGSAVRPFMLNHPSAQVCNVAIQDFTSGGNYDYGKGAYIDSLGGTVSNCVIRNCKAPGWGAVGGGIYMCGPGLVTHTVISNCLASTYSDGGIRCGTSAIYMTAGTVRNCLLVHNYVSSTETGSGNGGTVSLSGGVIENCTIADNEDRSCGGIYAQGSAVVRNCVIAGNRVLLAGQDESYAAWRGTASCFSHCTVDVEPPNADCEEEDAPFVSAATGDFSLAAGCAAVDFAAEQSWMTDATDLAGSPRISGDAPDAGCYEMPANVFSASVRALTATEAFAPLTVDFEVTYVNDGGEGVTCYWYEGAATEPFATTTETTYRFARTATGRTNLRLVVKDNATDTLFEVPGSVPLYAAPKTLYVAPKDGETTNAIPYDTPETAAAALADAYEAALPGATIVLLPGIHVEPSALVVNKGVSLVGGGARPEDVELRSKGGTSTGRFFYLDHADATVANLTMDGKYKGTGVEPYGGLVDIEAGGTVTNCILRNGQCINWGYYGAAVYMQCGTLTHCVITNNCVDATINGGEGTSSKSAKGIAVHMRQGRIENCLFAYNYCGNSETSSSFNGGAVYIANGSLVNCTVVSNSYPGCAGVYAAGGAVANCLIVGNHSTAAGGEADVWRGEASCFVNCLSDSAAAINGTCLTGDTGIVKDFDGGDFRLLRDTAAVNAGVKGNGMVYEATDLAGGPRVSGGRIDIGCYETYSDALRLILR